MLHPPGRFETALMLAVRPELAHREGLARIGEGGDTSVGWAVPLAPRSGRLPRAHRRRLAGGRRLHEPPGQADAGAGSRYLEVISREVAAFLDALATR